MNRRVGSFTLAATLLFALAVTAPVRAQTAADTSAPRSLTSLGFGDTDVRGLTGSAGYFVPIPGAEHVAGAVNIDLDFSHSAVLLADRSTVTLRINDVSVATTFLTPANRDHGRLSANVPPELIGTDGLFVEARFFMRLSRDECEDDTNPGLWSTVHGVSTVTLPTQLGGPRSIKSIGKLLVPATAADAPATIVLPDRPNAGDLRAAGVAASTLGAWLGAANRDAVVATATTPPVDAPSVLIGTNQAIADFDASRAGHGALAVSNEGPVQVTVTGTNAAALLRAATTMSRATKLDGAAVGLSTATATPDPARSAPWTASAASFAQLGVTTNDITGLGTHDVALELERPAGWKLTKSGTLELGVDAAPGVRSDASFIQATLNGHDLGTRRLRPTGGVTRYRFRIPSGLADRGLDGQPTRSLTLRLRVHLAPTRHRCVPLDIDSVRVTLTPTSSITLPHTEGARFELGRFPASLTSAPIVVVIADARPAAISAGVQMAASIGRWLPAGHAPPIVERAADITGAQRSSANLVLLGQADRALDRHVTLGTEAVGAAPGDDVAVLGLVSSPFSSERTALIVHGSETGIAAAARMLGSRAAIEKIHGERVALVGADGFAEVLQPSSGVTPPPELAPVLKGEGLRNQTIVAGIVLAAFLLIVGLMIRFRWWGRVRT